MKQNSSILFHCMCKSLRNSYLQFVDFVVLILSVCLAACLPARVIDAADRPEYLASFDPAKGFKPARTDLTEIFLQIAGSLEFYGSPEPYLRHMKSEHARIEAKYRERFGTAAKSYCPPYMTDQYLAQFAANWKILSGKFGLTGTTKDIGNIMRDGILGTRRTGTTLVGILNHHQAKVFDRMAGKPVVGADFETLEATLIKQLEIDRNNVDEWGYEIPRRDAVTSTVIIRGFVLTLFERLDKNLKPEDAAKIKTALTAVFTDVGRMAHSELEVGIAEWAMQENPQTAFK